MEKNKKGFTLIELVIVISVIAVLAAVLIPTFAGIVTRANAGKEMEQAISARDSYFSGNEEMASITEMKDYLIEVKGTNYVVLENGELDEIANLAEFKKENDLDFEIVDENTFATVYKPVEVLPVDPYTPGTFDSEGNFESWEDVVEEGKLVISGTTIMGVTGNLTTENLVVGHEITAIAANAFKNNTGIKKITLHENFTTLGNQSFRNSKIEEIDFNGAQIETIPYYCFFGCHELTEVVLPEGLETIGENGVSYCYDLETLVLPSTLTRLEKYALQNNPVLQEIILPEGLEYIGACAFDGCESVHELVIPESVTYIGYYALDLWDGMDYENLNDNPVYTIRFNFTEATKNVSRSIDSSAIYYNSLTYIVDDYFMEVEMQQDMEEQERQWCEENGEEYIPSSHTVTPLTGSLTLVIEYPQKSNGDSYCSGLTNLVEGIEEEVEYGMYGMYGDYNVNDYVHFIVRDIQD